MSRTAPESGGGGGSCSPPSSPHPPPCRAAAAPSKPISLSHWQRDAPEWAERGGGAGRHRRAGVGVSSLLPPTPHPAERQRRRSSRAVCPNETRRIERRGEGEPAPASGHTYRKGGRGREGEARSSRSLLQNQFALFDIVAPRHVS